MPYWVWICLGLSFGVVTSTMFILAIAGIKLWRRIRALEKNTGIPIESLLSSLEMMGERLDHANSRSEEIQERLDDLKQTMENVAIIRWALSDTRSAAKFWRSLSGR